MHYLRGIYHKTTVKISKPAGIESLHFKRKGMLFPSDLKQKLCIAETCVVMMARIVALLVQACYFICLRLVSVLFHEIQRSQSNNLHSFHMFFLQVCETDARFSILCSRISILFSIKGCYQHFSTIRKNGRNNVQSS